MGNPAKEAIRQRVWRAMEERGVARFPRPIRGRIPNFVGAEDAAERATRLAAWQKAEVIKANPDSAQAPLRRRALEEGKRVYMAVPRLRQSSCFLRLDPRTLRKASQAAPIAGAFRYGAPVDPREMEPLDLVVVGSVAVNRKGARIGKGGGYSDLEYAIAHELGLVEETTPILTTVHPCQVLDEGLPMEAHDEPVDFIVTPDEIIPVPRTFSKPRGILWDLLSPERIAEIPILEELMKSREGLRVPG